MIEIKPSLQHHSTCPYCQADLKPDRILWQGMHICVNSECLSCNKTIIENLRVGHNVTRSCQIDLEKGAVWNSRDQKSWLGEPLLQSLKNPQPEKIKIIKEVFKECKRVIILNCIDYLYGHCLLKLLNAQRHLDYHSEYGLVVIIPKFLRWMIPEGVAEIWTVDISLPNARYYYPSFNQFISKELERFDEVYLSKAHSHPSHFDISRFTGVPKHNFEREDFRITFIWREDRLWTNFLLFKISRRLSIGMPNPALWLQNWKVRRLLGKIRDKFPSAKFAVVGMGKKTRFPAWIEDLRVDKFDEKVEKEMCQVYSSSRLVIGIHGSNMLLPSAHAGMIIDLMPPKRWANLAQDILYQESDPRIAALRYRYVPFTTSITQLAEMVLWMPIKWSNWSEFVLNRLLADKLL